MARKKISIPDTASKPLPPKQEAGSDIPNDTETRTTSTTAASDTAKPEPHIVDLIHASVEKHGGFDLELPPRETRQDPPYFSTQARHQSLAVATSENAQEDQDFISSVSLRDHE